jgi:hypothetical protein
MSKFIGGTIAIDFRQVNDRCGGILTWKSFQIQRGGRPAVSEGPREQRATWQCRHDSGLLARPGIG